MERVRPKGEAVDNSGRTHEGNEVSDRAYRAALRTGDRRSRDAVRDHRRGRVTVPRRLEHREDDEQKYDPEGPRYHGLQGPDDRPWIPRPRVDHPARA